MKRGALSALALCWLAVTALGLWRLEFDVQVLNLLPSEVPAVRALKAYEDHFANASELVISLQGLPPAELEEAARHLAETLRSRTNLVRDAIWTPPWTEHPEQMAAFVAYLWLNQPPEAVENLAKRLAPGELPAQLEQTKQQLAITLSPEEIARLGYDPFRLLEIPGEAQGVPGFGDGGELFASADGRFRLLFVHAASELRGYRESQAWLGQIKTIIEAWHARTGHLDLALKYTGRPAFISEISSGMERDITGSVGGTLLIIAALFYWAHRRFKPLLWLVTLLFLVLATTLALGGLIFGTLNVISAGFAAILLGLSVDYGLVLYQEWLASNGAPKQAIRRSVGPGIAWAAASTAAAFLILNLGGLPGLAQLGALVGLGVAVSACIMLGFFLAPLGAVPGPRHSVPDHASPAWFDRGPSWALTALIAAAAILLLWKSPPRIDVSSAPLRPARSAAYIAVEEIKLRMNRPEEPLWLLARGDSFGDLAQSFERAQPILAAAVSNSIIARATLPAGILPRPERQQRNKSLLAGLAARQPAPPPKRTENALALLERIFATWRAAAASAEPFLPREGAGRWILERFLSMDKGAHLAMGLVHPAPETPVSEIPPEFTAALADAGLTLTGWELLGTKVFSVIRREFPLIIGLMALMVLVCLAFAFRRPMPVILSLCSLAVSASLLLIIMEIMGWRWNLMNLMAAPLLIGAGLDYGIHVQLALDRREGRIREMRATVGRALLLCAGTTFAGFASLAWAGNPGLGSLGKVCASGIAAAYFVAVWLLPAWWTTLARAAKQT